MKLTDKQMAMITAVGKSQYGDGPGSQIWSWDVCGDRSSASVLGSLMKRGLVGQSGDRKEAVCWLTEEGVAAFYELNPRPAPAPAPAKKKAAKKAAAKKRATAKAPKTTQKGA